MSAADPVPTADIEMGGGGTAPLEVDLPPDPEVGKGFLKPIPETTTIEKIAGGAACCAVITALAAMIVEGGPIVLIGGILSAIVGPYAYWQQVQLTDIKALQETQEKIQVEVDRLAAENNRLAKNIDEMSDTVQDLKDVEDALEIITKTQGQTVEAFAEQVQENRSILAKMQDNLTGTVLNNLLSLIFSSDTNQDEIVNEHEVDVLVDRIGAMSGVEINEPKLRAAIVGKHTAAVMDLIKNLLQSDLPDEEKIFKINQ